MAHESKLDKELRKDPTVARDVRNEIEELMRDGTDAKPLIKNPNRDQARGDADRSGLHHVEEIEPE
jgi:hypothetical protein